VNRMKYQKPRDVRFTHNRRGELRDKGTRFPCLIQDISVKGVLGICARNLEVGQELEVTFDLTPEHVHRCKVRVQHVEQGCFGAEIIDVGEQENKVFHQYIERRFKELKNLPAA
jgi:hypothetical protein